MQIHQINVGGDVKMAITKHCIDMTSNKITYICPACGWKGKQYPSSIIVNGIQKYNNICPSKFLGNFSGFECGNTLDIYHETQLEFNYENHSKTKT